MTPLNSRYSLPSQKHWEISTLLLEVKVMDEDVAKEGPGDENC